MEKKIYETPCMKQEQVRLGVGQMICVSEPKTMRIHTEETKETSITDKSAIW